MQFAIDDMRRDDWTQVRQIYREGLASGLAAFTLNPPTWKAWDAGHLPLGRLVARARDRAVVGWSALAPVTDT